MVTDFYWLNKKSVSFLKKDYLLKDEEPIDRIKDIGRAAQAILGIPGFADKFFSYMSKGYYSLSSPIWANFGRKRGFPISCNGSYIQDNTAAILYKFAEIGMMTKYGAGTSAYFSHLRPRGSEISSGGKSFGPVHFMKLFDVEMEIISQGSVRRGAMAAYLDIDHPDFYEFLEIRKDKHPIQHLSIGICVSDNFMNRLLAKDKEASKRWAAVIKKRFESGYPYIFFSDTVNNNAPQVYKDKGMRIHASNLCSEINLSSSPDESFVCNLSSMNLYHYDDWKDTDAVETLVYFLDAVMTEYIDKTIDIPFMKHANNFAQSQRALGVGVLGWHSLLQKKLMPFEGLQTNALNIKIHKLIRQKCEDATESLAKKYGEPELLKGYNRRNSTVMAIAPTLSSSFILGQMSSGIEPIYANYHIEETAKGSYTYKNPLLFELLDKHKKNDKKAVESILKAGGSIQHLDFLSDEEKAAFKTFGEISQMDIIIQAASRQKFIDQSQSLNLCIHHKTPAKDVNALMIEAWKLGVKTMYYQRGTSPVQEFNRKMTQCTSCEG